MQSKTSRFVCPAILVPSHLRLLLALVVAIGSAYVLPAHAQTYDANADYNINPATANNPNGVWTYGWSTSPTAALNLYTRNYVGNVGPTADLWDDPTHITGNVPDVYKNIGADYPDDGNISIPANALILHGGGPNGSGGFEDDFSNVVFTAPSTGAYALTSTFQLRQHVAFPASVQVLENGVSLFDGALINFLDSAAYSNSFQLQAGDQLDFAVGFATAPPSLSGNSVEFDATLVEASAATPEPGSLTMLLGAGIAGGMLLRRRRR